MEGSYNKNALILENKCSGKPETFGNVQNEQFPSRYYLMYRCQCEVARACLRRIRSFAHFHFFLWMSFFFITQNQTILLNLAFQSLSTDFLFTSVTGSSTSRCGYSSPSSIHFRRISTAFCAFFCTSCFMVVSLGVEYCA